MLAFHQRYMVNNKACQIWVHTIRQLDVEMIMPQHGSPLQGKEVVRDFLNWLEALPCGVD